MREDIELRTREPFVSGPGLPTGKNALLLVSLAHGSTHSRQDVYPTFTGSFTDIQLILPACSRWYITTDRHIHTDMQASPFLSLSVYSRM